MAKIKTTEGEPGASIAEDLNLPAVPESPNLSRVAVVEGCIDSFINTHLRNTPFSQNTAAWNHFISAKAGLAETIIKELSK